MDYSPQDHKKSDMTEPLSHSNHQAPLILRPLLLSGPTHTQVPPIRLHSHSGLSYHQAPPTPRPLLPSGPAHTQVPPLRLHSHSGLSYHQAPPTPRPLLPSGPPHTQVPPIRLHSHSGPSYHQAPPTPRPLRIWNPLIHRPFPLLLEIPSLFFYGSEPRRSKISPSFSTCWRLGCNI